MTCSGPEDLVPFEAAPGGVVIRGMRGGAAGPIALLVHGTGGSWRNFSPWLPALLPRAHLIIPDLPGFGQSPAPAARPGLFSWAELLRALVASLGAEPRILVGLGMGASLAMAYLSLGEGTVAAGPPTHVVLHTPATHPGAVRPTVRWAVRLLGAPPAFVLTRRILESRAFRTWYARTFVEGADIRPEDAAILREDYERASIPVLRGLIRDMVGADFRLMLRRLTAPTLLMLADDDPFVDARRVREVASSMPQARVAVQSGPGHGWTAQAIAQHHAWLADFLGAAQPAGVQRP